MTKEIITNRIAVLCNVTSVCTYCDESVSYKCPIAQRIKGTKVLVPGSRHTGIH